MVYNLKMLSKRYVAFTRVVKESLDAIPLELAKDHPLQLEYILLKTKYLGFIRQWDEWLVVDQDHSQKTKILLEILSDLKNHISRFLKALNQISDDYRKEILDINLKKFIEVEERILDVIKQFNSNDLNQILQQYHEILEWTFKEYLNLIIGGILYDPMGKNFTLRNYVESVFEKAGVYLPREISNQLVQEKLFRVCKMAFLK
ncbi:MAG: hypothetical protein HWD59_11835 [Coxiellaceae bacterium]|nr:MAG: hypothetical protein HWD59_11835 [Coxiellaceae bacterium]